MRRRAGGRGLRALLLAFGLWLLAFGGLALGQARTDLRGIVPGDRLGWEIQELRASVVVREPTVLNLQIYSPGFDPADYRSALKGQDELGDERYDRGRGEMAAQFALLRDGEVLARQTYRLEPHRWVLFFRGRVEPGIYQLSSRLLGMGKNAFRYRIQTGVPEAAELLVDPTLQLYDVRQFEVGSPLSVATVRGRDWLEPFTLEVSPEVLPLRVGFYDEDGPREMEGRVRLPDGRVEGRGVSGDRAWAYYDLRQPGRSTFGFRQPASTAQYSNTIGFRVDACMEVAGGGFRVVPPRPVRVSVADAEGRPLALPTQTEGDKLRSVRLGAIPEGYRLLRLEVRGGERPDPQTARFGCAGGEARFVLERAAAAEAALELEAVLVLPDGERAAELGVRVGETAVGLAGGRASLRLPPGEYPLAAEPPGARVEGPRSVRLESGQTARVRLRVFPEVRLTLEADPALLRVGQETTLTARVSTAFPGLLPAEVELELPPCLEPLGGTRLTAPVSQSRSATLRVRAEAVCRGEPEVVATLAPWGQQAGARLRVVQPATFGLRKEAHSPSAAAGDPVTYRLRVHNGGDEAGEVRVLDGLAAGLLGAPLDQTLRLEAGEARTLEVRALITAEAPETVVNTAQLLDAGGRILAESRAEVRVLRPRAELSRSLDKRIVVPGEWVEVRLAVRNAGQAPLRYRLADAPPEWLEVAQEPQFGGELAPGAGAVHLYRARVRFGSPAEGGFEARLTSNGGNPVAPDTLRRALLGLEKAAEPGRVVAGSPAAFLVRLRNPTDHAVALELQEAPDEGLRMQLPDDLRFTLAAGEVRELRLEAQPARVGALENQVTALVGGVPASFPAKATLLVLPVLEPLRLSTVQLEFAVLSAAAGERLLLSHLPPEGALYEPGSARLDGRPLPDPRVAEDGRLFFELPYQAGGLLSYQLRHREGLGPIAEPTLTLRVADREVYLQGRQPYAEFERARALEAKTRDGFIQEPLPGTLFRVDKARVILQTPNGLETRLTLNGEAVDAKNLGKATYDSGAGLQRLEYYGLPLRPGRNLIEVETAAGSDRVEVFLAGSPARLEIRPLRLLADGRTPLELELLALDAGGLPSGFGALTVETGGEPLEADAFPGESGYQLLLRDGRAVLRLRPTAAPGRLRVRLALGELRGEAEFFVLGRQGSLWQLQGSVGARFGESVQVFGLGRGYLESPLAGGTLRAALDGSLRFEQGRPQVHSGLGVQPDPAGRFPLTGGGAEPALPLRSDDPVALRYDQEGFSLGYFADRLSVFGVGELPQGTALRLETRDDLAVQGFAGWLPLAAQTDLIVPDGTRLYRLAGPAEPGSEQVTLLVGAAETRLERLRDYVLDGPTGTLTLAAPLWPSAPDFRPVRLRVTYAPLGGARALGYGAGSRWRLGAFSVGGGAAFLPGQGWRYGAEAAYQAPGFGLRAGYSRGSAERFGLELSGKGGALEASANLSYEGRLRGQAQVGLALSEADRVSLEHTAADANRSDLLYTRRLGPAFSVGGGLGYTWESASLAALGRLGLGAGALKAELTHAQPFSLAQSAQTRLKSTYAFDANLSAEADLTATWGLGLAGTVGLRQRLEAANLSLSYQLPGASGEGNRARFGLEAPLPLTERWSLNASAGYERSLASGLDQLAFGLALRYQSPDFSATLGGETALAGGSPKVVLRAGAAGQLDAQQTLSLDANYQIAPALEGRFTLAYALRGRDASLLSYHRLTSLGERVLEGALAASYHPDPGFQLRPGLAYRLKLDDPAGHTYQLGLGANRYLSDWFGLGAAAHYQFQPGTASGAAAFSLEASLRVVEGLWLNAGYTFGGFAGLTPDTAPGFYLRLDFLGGGR